MVRYFRTVDKSIVEETTAYPGGWIALTNPTAGEILELADLYQIDVEDLKAPLDEEERSRLVLEDNYSMVLVDIPVTEERNNKEWYVTIPMSIIMTKDYIFTVCLQDNPVLESFMEGRIRDLNTNWKTRFILQVLYKNASWYLHYLRVIDKKSEQLEGNLHSTMKNHELIELMELEKSLLYFTTSLRSNEVVLEKLLKTEKIKKYPEDEELLEDVIIENKQAIEMAGIYSGILRSMVDVFASVSANNLNGVMKYLASITIVMSIPTMIASFYGMNMNAAGMPFSNSIYGFAVVIAISLLVTLIVAMIFRKRELF